MSDQPKWRPSDEEIAEAINEYMKRLARKYMGGTLPGGVVDDLQDNPVVDLIDRAVEKALAERMEKLVSDDGIKFDGWPEGTDMAREIEWAAGVILADDRLHRCVNFMVGGRAQAKVEKALAEQKAEWANQIALERKKLASDPVYAEKAVIFELRRELAEERDKWTSYFGASAQNFLEQEEKTEARHKREVLEARVEELDNATSTVCLGCAEGMDYFPADGSHRRQISDDGDVEGGPCNCHELSDRLHGLRAELAALDKEVK